MKRRKPARETDDIRAFIVDRVFTALENITGDIKEVLTNPFGLGAFMKKLGDKDDPLIYIPSVWAFGAIMYGIAARYGGELGGPVILTLIGITSTLIVIFRFIESFANRRKKQ